MTEAEKERAAIVAWLRGNSDVLAETSLVERDDTAMLKATVLQATARMIERGDHIAAAEGEG